MKDHAIFSPKTESQEIEKVMDKRWRRQQVAKTIIWELRVCAEKMMTNARVKWIKEKFNFDNEMPKIEIKWFLKFTSFDGKINEKNGKRKWK